LLLVVPPSSFNEAEIQKLIHKEMKKHTRNINISLEPAASKSLVWMPYYRVRFEYKRSEKELAQRSGETAQSETAIDAMFCGCAQGEDELFWLFRPNYLKYNMIQQSPQIGDVVGPSFQLDFDAFLLGLLKRLNKAEDEFHERKSASNKSYRRIRRYSRIWPMAGELKEAEKSSKKIAELDALTNILRLALNLPEQAESIRALSNSTFYYPTTVVALRNRENEPEWFLIINLVKSGLVRKSLNLDNGLTRLCNDNDACKEVLTKLLA